MATTSKILTYEEWLGLPEVEGVEEVVNGEIVKMPPNKWIMLDVVENLARPAQERDWIPRTTTSRTSRLRASDSPRATWHSGSGSGSFHWKQCRRTGRLHPLRAGTGGGSAFARQHALRARRETPRLRKPRRAGSLGGVSGSANRRSPASSRRTTGHDTLLRQGQLSPRVFPKPRSTSPPSGPNKKRRVRSSTRRSKQLLTELLAYFGQPIFFRSASGSSLASRAAAGRAMPLGTSQISTRRFLAGVGVFDRRASALLGSRGRYGARSRHGRRFLRRSNPAPLDAGRIERTAGAAATAQHCSGVEHALPIQIAAPARPAAAGTSPESMWPTRTTS